MVRRARKRLSAPALRCANWNSGQWQIPAKRASVDLAAKRQWLRPRLRDREWRVEKGIDGCKELLQELACASPLLSYFPPRSAEVPLSDGEDLDDLKSKRKDLLRGPEYPYGKYRRRRGAGTAGGGIIT